MAYTQADAEVDLVYMEIPRGFTIDGERTNNYVLQLLRNLYGQKQAGRVWFQHLFDALKRCGFTQSQHEPMSASSTEETVSTFCILMTHSLLAQHSVMWTRSSRNSNSAD